MKIELSMNKISKTIDKKISLEKNNVLFKNPKNVKCQNDETELES